MSRARRRLSKRLVSKSNQRSTSEPIGRIDIKKKEKIVKKTKKRKTLFDNVTFSEELSQNKDYADSSLCKQLQSHTVKTQENTAPQCVGMSNHLKSMDCRYDIDSFRFSFKPFYRYKSPSSDESYFSDSDSEKSLYLSRRMSIKLTKKGTSPLTSPIRARRLVFTPDKERLNNKEVKIIKKYAKKKR